VPFASRTRMYRPSFVSAGTRIYTRAAKAKTVIAIEPANDSSTRVEFLFFSVHVCPFNA
jgi:hypothetical protein